MAIATNRINDKANGKALLEIIATLVAAGEGKLNSLTVEQIEGEARKVNLSCQSKEDKDGNTKLLSPNAVSRARTRAINIIVEEISNGAFKTSQKEDAKAALRALQDVSIVKRETAEDIGFEEGDDLCSFVSGLGL